jgi:16S rRNA processing protein RimM
MMETGANDVLVVKARSDDEYEIKERLIPYLPHVVKNVNLDDKVILVDWEPDF